MKVLSLWQPWATLIALGKKRVETRSWSTPYRGEVAIHAAKHWNRKLDGMCCTSPFIDVLGYQYHDGPLYRYDGVLRLLPFGSIVATAQIVDVVPTSVMRPTISVLEASFGDYSQGRYAWLLDNVRPLSDPFPLAGRQGLFNADIPPEALP